MFLTVDIGNTCVKQAWWNGRRKCKAPADGRQAEHALVCASGSCDLAALNLPADQVILLSHETPLPITLDYETPQTLGPDRIAAACGACRSHRDTLIVDAGTCITIDFLDADGVYHGGAILPGIGMQFRALHRDTAKLPLVKANPCALSYLAGHNTVECITAGVVAATRLAVREFISDYSRRFPRLQVLLTGGDAPYLQHYAYHFTHDPDLVMKGLNEVLLNL